MISEFRHLIDKDKFMCSCNQFAFKKKELSICNQAKYNVAFSQVLP